MNKHTQKLLCLLLGLLFSCALSAQQQIYLEDDETFAGEPIYNAKDVDEPPRFYAAWCEQIFDETNRTACWTTAMNKYLNYFKHYPKEAKKNKVEGDIRVYFVVEKDGTVSNVQTVLDLDHGCKEEAIRIVELMPKFIPAVHDAEVVRSLMMVTVSFERK